MDEHGTGATTAPRGDDAATAIGRNVDATLARQLLLMVERVTDGLAAFDRDFRFVYVNPRAGELFACDPASLIGQRLWDAFPHTDGEPTRPAYERAMATQEPVRIEEPFAPTGRWFEKRAFPSPDGLSVLLTDITERRETERALREREARYRLVAGAGPTMLFEYSLDTGVIWREGGLLASLGYEPEANAESFDWWMERIHPDERASGHASMTALLTEPNGTDEASFGYRFQRRDGSYAALSGQGRLTRDATGAPRSIVGVMTDSTDRRAMEDALRESEARFRAFVEQASDAVMVVDTDGTFRYVSPSMTRMLGHAPETMIGQNGFAFVHPDDVTAAADALAAGPGSGILPRAVLRVRHADGSWHHAELTGRSLDAHGPTAGVLVHLRDVSDRIAAERSTREIEERFRALTASAPIGVFQSDLLGAITYVNPRILQIFEMTEAEGLGYGWVERVHSEDRDALLASWALALAAGTDFRREYRLLMPDGSVRWIDGRSAPLRDASGRLVGSVGTIEDLTQRRRLEQQLLHSQKLDAVGQLSGGVAHDFNNLLMVIQANVDLVRAMAGAELQAELDEIRAATARAAQLTRQLLAFSRRQVLQPTALDLNDVVLDAERLLRRLLGERIFVEVVLAPDLWHARADAGQMEQVLMNLAVNARDAMSADGGTLTIETSNVPAAASGTARDCVRLRVRDTGTGMTSEVRDRAFDPFFTTKPPGVGTGLGLAMVYGIVTQSDGTVHVESRPGAGSEFVVLLPRDESAPSAPVPVAAPAPAAAPGGSERLLLVEDEAAVRGVARRILERAGYSVLEARHGADALLVWREHSGEIDLLLTDVRMPEMGGLELVAALRAERATLPVVVMSGYADAGAPGNTEWFLEKPFSREVLLRCVRRALEGERP